ncbi:MAG: tRNA U-34 5-methylaminomethyl-2-thiouridine biosynthesis protein [Myxococcota bacterium]
MAPTGRIVAGALAPHPPHLVYAENPPQNEPRAQCGWETLRWGYERLRKNLDKKDIDVIIVHSPHWRTITGTHILAVPHCESLSVDPIFPNLFRFNYSVDVDVELARAMHAEASSDGLEVQLMENPDFRVDYGTIVALHMVRPQWDLPIVAVSSTRTHHYFNNDVGTAEQLALGEATRRAVESTGRKALLLASNSLSHRHFTVEPPIAEDMSQERIYHHGQYLWDMHVLDLMRKGQCQTLLDEMPDFIEQATSECKEGCLQWMLGAMGIPDYPAEVHGYGTVIGTGNAIVEWDPDRKGVTP